MKAGRKPLTKQVQVGYKIHQSDNRDLVSDRVNEDMGAGWQLWGPTGYIGQPDGRIVYTQAMKLIEMRLRDEE